MNAKKYLPWFGAGIIIIYAVLYLVSAKTITLVVDGQPREVTVHAFTAGGAAAQADAPLTELDQISPSARSWIANGDTVEISSSRPVTFYLEKDRKQILLTSAERIPVRLAMQAGIPLSVNDRIWWNGQPVDPQLPLPLSDTYFLHIRPARPVTLTLNGETKNLNSSAFTLIGALTDFNIPLRAVDRLSLRADELLNGPITVSLDTARRITIQIQDKEITSAASATTVGKALASAGVALQDLDYSIPAEDQPIPEDGRIRVVRVREELISEQTTIPYSSQVIADPETELDQRSIVTAGEPGIKVSRVRVRYEDGKEAGRVKEAEWVAKEPIDQINGYGTKVVIRTMSTPNGTIEYWRAVNVYATSYNACESGSPLGCASKTASGLTVTKGIAAVRLSWYRTMYGQYVYVPGYGKAMFADVGGGVPGKYWIDLGYSEDDYIEWHQDLTIYFLTPVPENIIWPLP